MAKAKLVEQKKYTKSTLSVKACVDCGKPMEWRKRQAKVWTEVNFCSEKCRRNKKSE